MIDAPRLPLTPDPGPERPASSPAKAGLFPSVGVLCYQPSPGAVVTIVDDLEVGEGTVYRLGLHPELGFGEQGFGAPADKPTPDHGATRIGVRARTAVGASEWLLDQHGLAFTPDDEGVLWSDQWNLVDLDLSPFDGQTVALELVAGDHANGRGWLQVVGQVAAPLESDDVVARVRTTRGTHQRAGESLSRGNTFPLTCVPHGFNFVTPVTDARTSRWLYGWTGSDFSDDPRPALQALAFCHQPSPWIADRFAFQVMPWQGQAHVSPHQRQRGFDHELELDQPHHYRVELDGGITAEMTPTSRAASFRFTFTEGEPCGVVLDQPERGELTVEPLPDGRLSFTATVRGNRDLRHPSATALIGFVYGETRQPARATKQWSREGIPELPTNLGRRITHSLPESWRLPWPRPQSRVLTLTDGGHELEVVAAMSFISTAQARRNLELEIGESKFDQIKQRAHDEWAELLGRLEITGGTIDQRMSAWSNLARLYCWPNEHHENLGTHDAPRWAHASPVKPLLGRHRADHTAAEVVSGISHVNNGYWDTYRTCWPAYHLFTPQRSTDLLNGQIAHYREGGWMPRWCAPGYVDCMVGTSSDAIFADAAAHGLSFAELTAYDSALRNATCVSELTLVGRNGLQRGRFVGHIDTDTAEGFSWSMENANCDAALAWWSRDLAKRADEVGAAERRAEFEANALWFAHRSLGWQTLFDARTGFLQGKRPDGSWRVSAEDYDPEEWGYDYTETNGWGMAFSVPHDGAGLARELGGEHELSAKLQRAEHTTETAAKATAGSYPTDMHERVEARALRLGMIGMSNQPAHHIPFMYAHTGDHHRTQWLTREILQRLFVGSEIGQGYPGDEDNGEMSAWWLLAAFGLYPAQVGAGELVLTAPLFEQIAFTRDDGHRLEVRATGVEHRHIQSVTINGEPWHQITVPVSLFRDDVVIEVTLGEHPSEWARDSRPVSISTTAGFPDHWSGDVTSAATSESALGTALIDDHGTIQTLAAGEVVEVSWPTPASTQILTLTTEDLEPAAVTVQVCSQGAWLDTQIKPRAALWANQTQAYACDFDQVTGVRLQAQAEVRLRQIELY